MLPIIWGLNQLGWHAAALVPLWIGPKLFLGVCTC
jgi:alkane 1-monooxygenase